MILTPKQIAATLAVLGANGTGTIEFRDAEGDTLVTTRSYGVVAVGRIPRKGECEAESYNTHEHFRLAYADGKPDFARAEAHYTAVAAEAKTLQQHVADGEGRN